MTPLVRRTVLVGSLLALGAAILALLAFERNTPGSLLPHGYCFTWNPTLLWTHVISDSLIGAAYVSIPVTLVHLLRKRRDIPFDGVVLLFAIFIVSCGATHWIEVWTVWNPDYWLLGNVKVLTAVASLLTAAALMKLVPRVLAIPTLAQLTAAKTALEAEVVQRRHAEVALLGERAELERRVLERTEALAQATARAESAHAAAEEANKLKDRFLAKVSHELRTPLQSTMTWAHVLKSEPPGSARIALAAERIQHNVRSQARLIDDLLDISRILSGKLGLELASLDVEQVIRHAADVVRAAASARSIAIEVEVEGRAGPVLGDPVRLEQVVWNLISNAVQATPEGGRVRVRAKLDAGTLAMEVRDWGRGIDPVDLAHIFEPFRQGAGPASGHRGLGLGLAITRSIVELFGGELRAESEGPGRGATFFVRLPLASPADEATRAGTGLTAGQLERLAGLRVVYVEDDWDIAEAGRQTLAALGVRVEVFLDFANARRRVIQGGFDVLLSDLNLGDGHTAIELLAMLRAAPAGRDVPALVFSAYGTDEDRAATRAAGFVRHLVKPVETAELARALVEAAPR